MQKGSPAVYIISSLTLNGQWYHESWSTIDGFTPYSLSDYAKDIGTSCIFPRTVNYTVNECIRLKMFCPWGS